MQKQVFKNGPKYVIARHRQDLPLLKLAVIFFWFLAQVAGQSQVVAGRSQVVAGRSQVVAGRCQVVAGRCQVVAGRCQVIAGQCQVITGRCQVVTAKWQGGAKSQGGAKLRWILMDTVDRILMKKVQWHNVHFNGALWVAI